MKNDLYSEKYHIIKKNYLHRNINLDNDLNMIKYKNSNRIESYVNFKNHD